MAANSQVTWGTPPVLLTLRLAIVGWKEKPTSSSGEKDSSTTKDEAAQTVRDLPVVYAAYTTLQAALTAPDEASRLELGKEALHLIKQAVRATPTLFEFRVNGFDIIRNAWYYIGNNLTGEVTPRTIDQAMAATAAERSLNAGCEPAETSLANPSAATTPVIPTG